MHRWIGIGLLALIASGCEAFVHNCTLVGCEDSLTIRISSQSSKPRPPGDYVVDIKADGVSSQMRCTLAGGVCSGTWGGMTFDSQQQTFAAFVAGTPRHVEVSVSYEGRTLATGAWDPAYDEFRPNGPSCDPVCRGAGVTLVADVPQPGADAGTD